MKKHRTYKKVYASILVLVFSTIICFWSPKIFAQDQPQPTRLLIKNNQTNIKTATEITQKSSLRKQMSFNKKGSHSTLEVWDIKKNVYKKRGYSLENIVEELRKEHPDWIIEPDHSYKLTGFIPDDPLYFEQSHLSDPACLANIDLEEAWSKTTGSDEVIIAIIDGGMDLDHEDLKDNLWKNPGEMGLDSSNNDKSTNGIDDDGNGYLDDVYGWDFTNNDNDPEDDTEKGHGTHVAGIIGGRGDNGIGITGVCQQIKLMPLKFTDASGNGYTSDAINAIEYVIYMKEELGKNIVAINASWGGGNNNSFLKDAIRRANEAGILFVAAAGNNGRNIDQSPFYPASFDLENIISVGAVNCDASLTNYSNYGLQSVDITAPVPGDGILSSVPENNYRTLRGTSMAAPQVTGGIGLLMAKDRETPLSHLEIKDILLETATPHPALTGKVVTGGNLNLANALLYESGMRGRQFTYGTLMRKMAVQDSILWLGTNNGLIRLNTNTKEQIRYTNANSRLPHRRIKCLKVDPQNRLWIGTAGGLVVFEDYGQLQSVVDLPILGDAHPTSLAIADEILLVGTNEGSVKRYHLPTDAWIASQGKSIPAEPIKSLYVGSLSTRFPDIYMQTSSAILKAPLRNPKSTSPVLEEDITQMAFTSMNTCYFWILSPIDGISIKLYDKCNDDFVDLDDLNGQLKSSLSRNESITQIALSSDSKFLWIGTDHGKVLRYNHANKELMKVIDPGRQLPQITSIYSWNNKVYVINATGNIKVFDNNRILKDKINVKTNDLPRYRINALASKGKKVLMATISGLMMLDNEEFSVKGKHNINSLVVDKDQKTWIGTTEGLVCMDTTDALYFVSDTLDLPNKHVQAVAADDEFVWAGTYGGLHSYHKADEKWQKITSPHLAGDSILSLSFENGRLWIGTEKGLVKYEAEGFERPFLNGYKILSLAPDTLNKYVWVGTEQGLFQLKGIKYHHNDGSSWTKWRVENQFSVANTSLPSDYIQALTLDKIGNLWIGTPNGGVKYDGENWEVYNMSNSPIPNNKILSLTTTEDNNVWVGTNKGIAIIDPEDEGFSIPFPTICPGDQKTFVAPELSGSTVKWYINDSLASDSINFTYTFDTAGDYLVKIEVYDLDGSISQDSAWVKVLKQIELNLPATINSAARAVNLYAGDFEQAIYRWIFDGDTISTESQLSIDETGIYTLEVEGCEVSSTDIEIQSLGSTHILLGDALPDGTINVADWLMVALLDGSEAGENVSLSSFPNTPEALEEIEVEDWEQALTADLTDTSEVNYKYTDVNLDGTISLDEDGELISDFFRSDSLPLSTYPGSPVDTNGLTLTMIEVPYIEEDSAETDFSMKMFFELEGPDSLLRKVFALAFRLDLGTIINEDDLRIEACEDGDTSPSVLLPKGSYADLGFIGLKDTVSIVGTPQYAKGRIGGGTVITTVEDIDTDKLNQLNAEVGTSFSIGNILLIDAAGNFIPITEPVTDKRPLTLKTDFVDVVNLHAQCVEDSLSQLSWSAIERGTASYIIERSMDSIAYDSMGIIQNNFSGTCEELREYIFKIETPSDTSYWYRLRIISNDSAIGFTPAIRLAPCNMQTTSTRMEHPVTSRKPEKVNTCYPNPTAGQISVNLQEPLSKDAIWEVYNLNGEKVLQRLQTPTESMNRMQLNLAHLPNGLYFVRLVSDHEVLLQEKILVQKNYGF